MIILAITAKTMVRAEPTASTQPLITTVSLTGVKHPTTRAAKVSFDKSKKYPANFSRLVSDFCRFSSFIFLTRSKLLLFLFLIEQHFDEPFFFVEQFFEGFNFLLCHFQFLAHAALATGRFVRDGVDGIAVHRYGTVYRTYLSGGSYV